MNKDESYIFWWIVVILLLIISLSSTSGTNSDPYDTCYDADPTQWTDIVCD